MLLRLIVLIVLALAAPLQADIVKLRSGGQVEGEVIKEDAAGVTVKLSLGVVTFRAADVAEIIRKPYVPPPKAPATPRPAQGAARLPGNTALVATLGTRPWAKDLQQVPATVIDAGVMRNVPYLSYQAAGDYELNIYGDPDHPVAVELGVYRELLESDEAKRRCL